MFGLTKSELATLKRLSTPIKIQDYLDSLPINWEHNGETYMSPRRVLREKKAHCLEGALLAAAALWIAGKKPLLLDLKTSGDEDHVVALYRESGRWGAISKTNHATLRFRDPVYLTIRELVLSYFHEYFNDTTGKKALRSYSTTPLDLRKFGTSWVTTQEDLYSIVDAIDRARHTRIMPERTVRKLRKADAMERRAGAIVEWKKNNPRT